MQQVKYYSVIFQFYVEQDGLSYLIYECIILLTKFTRAIQLFLQTDLVSFDFRSGAETPWLGSFSL